MPLEFDSISHGKVAFGFFNIETDLILLNQYFLFAGDFCNYISNISEKTDEFFETAWEVFEVKPQTIGNLMGAIRGIDYSGFIGEVYQRFPFPKETERFKQNPEGFKTRPLIEEFIQIYGEKTKILFFIHLIEDKIGIGEYLFHRTSFQELIKYIWMGGFPRWKDGVRPDYVVTMKQKIEESKNPLFYGCDLVP